MHVGSVEPLFSGHQLMRPITFVQYSEVSLSQGLLIYMGIGIVKLLAATIQVLDVHCRFSGAPLFRHQWDLSLCLA